VITVSILLAGTYLAITTVVDPAIQGLAEAVEGLEADAQSRIIPHLAQLDDLRRQAMFYVPVGLGAAAVMVAMLLLPFILWSRRKPAVRGDKVEEKKVVPKERDVGEDRKAEETGAIRLLSILQNKGRLIDFLEEDIKGYPDAQIGAAVRQIHERCREALRETITLSPIVSKPEGDPMTVPADFDPAAFRLTGSISGNPPYHGVLQHCGWKVTQIDLPAQAKGQTPTIVSPAEVELGSNER
jgi:hypothetical protein